MRAVVTGGAGFIGSHVVDALARARRRGAPSSTTSRPAGARSCTSARACTSTTSASRFERRAPTSSSTSPRRRTSARRWSGRCSTRRSTCVGTVNVLEAARAAGAQLVFTSTGGAIYGECERPAREDDPRRPVSPYGIAEARRRGVRRGLEPHSRHEPRRAPLRERLRPAAVGRRSRAASSRSSSTACARRARRTIFGDGEQTRDFVYVGDVVDAVLAAAGATAASTTSARASRRPSTSSTRCAPRSPGATPRPRHASRAAGRRPAQRARSRARERRARLARRGRRSSEGLRLTWDSAAASDAAPRGRSSRSALAVWLGTALSARLGARTSASPLRRRVRLAASDLLFRTFAQWDARWFVQIAEHGYDEVPQAAAFFPLYPALVHALAWVTGSTLVAGMLISLASRRGRRRPSSRSWRGRCSGDRGRARRRPLPRALPHRVRLHGRLLGRALPRARGRRRSSRPSAGGRCSRACSAASPPARGCIGLALLPALAVLLWRGRGRRAAAGAAPARSRPPSASTRSTSTASSATPWAFATAQTDWDRDAATLGPARRRSRRHAGGRARARDLARAGGAFTQVRHGRALERDHLALLAAAVWLTWVAWRRLGPRVRRSTARRHSSSSSRLRRPAFRSSACRASCSPTSRSSSRSRPSRSTGRACARSLLCTFAALGAVAAVGFSRGIWIA